MTALTVATGRTELAEFVGRAVQLDLSALARLRAAGGTVVVWATTPFGVLATRSVPGVVEPADVTVPAAELLAALAVSRSERLDPGTRADAQWRFELPPAMSWRVVGSAPASELAALADAGVAEASAVSVTHGSSAPAPPAALLDRVVWHGDGVGVPLRVLFALSGLGYLVAGDPGAVRVAVSEDGGWLRLETAECAVIRRRRTLLPLI